MKTFGQKLREIAVEVEGENVFSLEEKHNIEFDVISEFDLGVYLQGQEAHPNASLRVKKHRREHFEVFLKTVEAGGPIFYSKNATGQRVYISPVE